MHCVDVPFLFSVEGGSQSELFLLSPLSVSSSPSMLANGGSGHKSPLSSGGQVSRAIAHLNGMQSSASPPLTKPTPNAHSALAAHVTTVPQRGYTASPPGSAGPIYPSRPITTTRSNFGVNSLQSALETRMTNDEPEGDEGLGQGDTSAYGGSASRGSGGQVNGAQHRASMYSDSPSGFTRKSSWRSSRSAGTYGGMSPLRVV